MICNPNPRPDKGRPNKQTRAPATNPEIVRFFEEQRKLLPVVKTTRTPSGQILDWIPIESQHPEGGLIATPPPERYVSPAGPTHRPATFEMDDFSIERGPAGTVPVLRRDFSRLHVTDKLRDYPRKRKVDGRRLVHHAGKAPIADPDPFGYYHATSAQSATGYGCQAVLNMWDPYCELSGDHSLSQLGIQNYDNPKLQSLEAGWGVCQDQYGDWQPHLFTYYTTNGYDTDGDGLGGYNRDYTGWVQYDANVFPGIRINGSSNYGGGQTVITIKFQLWQGNWWFQTQGIWMGYYPASLFTGKNAGTTLGDHGEWLGFWGEVYSARSDPTRTTTDMGSGNFAEDEWTWSAFQSNTQIQTDLQGTMADSNGLVSSET